MRENKWWRCKRSFLYQAVQGNSHEKCLKMWNNEQLHKTMHMCTIIVQMFMTCNRVCCVSMVKGWGGEDFGNGIRSKMILKKLLYKRPKGDLSPSLAIRDWKRTLARKEAHTKHQHDINHSVWYFVFWLKRLGAGHVNYVETCSLKIMGTCVSDTWDNELLM